MVHAKALEIRWHDQMPIFSADFHALSPEQHRKIAHPYAKPTGTATEVGGNGAVAPTGLGGDGVDAAPSVVEVDKEEKIWRLATAGGDKLVRIWLVHPRPPPAPAPIVLVPSTSSKAPVPAPAPPPDTSPRVEYLATLKQHTGVVNVVRFCPFGEMLASAGDDGNVLFWVPGESKAAFGEDHDDKAYERESWRVKSMLRTKSGQEIYDLAWSPDGSNILVGSVDHTANIYDVSTGHLLHTIAEHTNYVQGVAWDPHNFFIATQSSDRSMHVYSLGQNSTGAFNVHAVGKSSRMEVAHQPGGSWRHSPPLDDSKIAALKTEAASTAAAASSSSSKDKGKEKEKDADKDVEFLPPRPGGLHRSVSQRSESDFSESSSTVASASKFSFGGDGTSTTTYTGIEVEEMSSMDPPEKPARPLSRRSSTSGSQSHPSHSPALIPVPSPHRHLRSPSPAPLPAVRIPLSPKLSPAPMPPVSTTPGGKQENIRLYGDANSTPFFRRLCWSTDGSLLLTPAGLFEDPYASIAATEDSSQQQKKAKEVKEKDASAAAGAPKPTVYIYSRSNVARPPIAHLPGHKTTSIAIRFCPILFELRQLRQSGIDGDEGDNGDDCLQIELGGKGVKVPLPGSEETLRAGEGYDEEKPKSLFDLPYRMVYAVATLDAVYLYDTQQASPICMFGNLHYAPFTDLTWSSDGQTLVVSSQDGYCSVVAFDPLELGTPYKGGPITLGPASQPSAPSHLSTVPAFFAAAAAVPKASPVHASPPPPPPTGSSPVAGPGASSSAPAVPEKRPAEAATAGAGEEPPVKKKKKAVLTHHGPLGS